MISVVIPLYNKELTIESTIRSVLLQTFNEFELIIVDDGSTDNSIQIVRTIFQDARIKIISQKNCGVSVARNRGVYEASYEYVAFLDGDDKWHPTYLEHVNSLIKLYPDSGMYCIAGLIEDSYGVHYRIANKYIGKTVVVDYFDSPYVFSHTSGTIVSKEKFLQTQGFPPGMKRSQDLSLFFEMGLKFPTVYLGLPLTKYVGDVTNQATSLKKNITPYMIWLVNKFASEIQLQHEINKKAVAFFKYDFRHRIKQYIRGHEHLDEFLGGLNQDVKKIIPKYELNLYKTKSRLSLPFINMTKLLWRMKGNPMTGEKVHLKKIPPSFFNW